MKAPLPLRRFIVHFVFIATYVALLVWGFWVDVPRGQQVAGQILAAVVVGGAVGTMLTTRGHDAAVKTSKPADLSDPAAQWTVVLTGTMFIPAVIISQRLELSFWTAMTISVPVTLLVYAAIVMLFRARRHTGPNPQQNA